MDKLPTFDKLTALSISIGVLSGVATFLAVGPASGIFFIWAATIAWGSISVPITGLQPNFAAAIAKIPEPQP